MIFVISGPSGSGKTTLRDIILKDKRLKRLFVKSVSLTTRPKRLGEKEGRDYFFVDTNKFNRLRNSKRILEWTRYLGYYYGTKKDFVEAVLREGKHILLCLDFKGARRIKSLYPKDTVTIFIMPPSIRELRKRIENRSKGVSKDEIFRRIGRAEAEISNAKVYDFSLKNTKLADASKRLKDIILKNAGNRSKE